MTFGLTACPGGDNNPTETECTEDSDCLTTQVCNDAGACVARATEARDCERDSQCNFDEYCAAGECAKAACDGDDDCVDGAVCLADACRLGCRDAEDCAEGETCDSEGDNATFRCEAAGCLSTGCVPDVETCDDSLDTPRCIPTGVCKQEADCAVYASFLADGEDYVCDNAQELCVLKPECSSDADCLIDEICEEREGERNDCRPGCRENDDCFPGEFCDTTGEFMMAGEEVSSFVCRAGCTSEQDCKDLLNDPDGGYICADLVCIPKCQNLDDCLDGQICTGDPRSCQGCTDDNQCPATQFCDLTRGYTPEDESDPTLGLCTDLPPDCPDDGYGENIGLDSAHTITEFPFIADGTMEDVAQPSYCKEFATQGDWFAVQANPGDVITVTLNYETAGANLDLSLKDSAGNDIVTSTRPPTDDEGEESVYYGVQLGDTFYIQVRGNIVGKNIPYVLSVDVGAPPACVDDMLEENDQADTPAAIDADVDYTDLEVCGSDRDFYELDVASNQVVKLETIAPYRKGNIDVFVTTPDGAPVASSTGANDNETLLFETEEAGKYIVEVAVAGGVGNIKYDLRWSQIPNQCADVFDQGAANDQCADAIPLTVTPDPMTPGISVYNSDVDNGGENLAVCTDGDWYSITLLPLQKVKVTAEYNARSSAGFVDLRLRGPTDCDIIAAFDNRERDATDPNIVRQTLEYTADTGGTFYIAATLDQGLNVSYNLNIEVTDAPPCDEDMFEDNDDVASAHEIDRANALAGIENSYSGLRFCDLDDDYFSLDLEVGDTVRWVVQHDVAGSKDLDATIFVPGGSNPVSGTSTDDDEEVTYTATTAGLHTLRVYGKTPIRTTYRLLTYVTPSGGTEVGPVDPDCPDIYENNDQRADAQELMPGVYDQLLVCGQPLDDDWYKVKIGPGQTLTARADLNHSAGNIDMFLYDDTGSLATLDRSQTIEDFEEVTYTSDREQFLFIKVNTYASIQSNTYTLTITADPAPTCADDSNEDNDDGANASAVVAPGLYDRLAKCEDDEDWFKFDVEENQLAEVYVNFRSDADIDVYVYSDEAGTNEIANGTSTSDGESVSFTAPDDAATAAMDAQTVGTYYVKIVTKTRSRLGYDLLLYRDLNNNGSIDADEGPQDKTCPDVFENNDQRADAAEIASGTYEGLRVCWRGGALNDNDYYEIFVPSGATVTATATFSHDAGDLNLDLYREGTAAPVAFGRTTTDDETVSFTNNSTGANYEIRVYGQGFNFENSYDLEVGLAFSTMCAEDGVGSPDVASAAVATAAGNYPDLYLCEGTEDFFKVSALAGEDIVAHVELNNRFGNLDVELLDSTDAVVATSTGDGNLESISFNAPAAGDYYLRVFPRDGVFIRNAYDLWLSVGADIPVAPFCPDGYERNDDREGAATLTVNTKRVYDDMIACGNDRDWYAVTGLTSGMANVRVFHDADTGADLDVEILAADGSAITSASTMDNDESADFSAVSGQTYYVGVENVAMGGVATPYRLYINSAIGACPEDTFEPNNNFASAKDLPDVPGSYTMGSCTTGGNQDDYFVITPTSSGNLKVVITADANDITLASRIVRGAGFVFADPASPTNRQVYEFNDAVAGERLELWITNGGGTGPYFIDVEN